MRIAEEDYLAHYGILRKSGRYPWGSGKNPNQRSKSFLDIIKEHEKEGLSQKEIADLYTTDDFPMTSATIRELKQRAVTDTKLEQIRTAQALRDKGMGASEIGRQMGLRESTVRSLLEPGREEKLLELQNTVDMLRRQVEDKDFIDVGANVELDLPIGMGENPGAAMGISADKFKAALNQMKEEGYPVHDVNVQTPNGMVKHKVLCKPGVKRSEAFANRDKVRLISEKTEDGGKSFKDVEFKPPLSISSKRVGIKYKEDGGEDADGVIYVRPGVKDLDMGKSRYSQVRIMVDGTHYLKGMAVYKNDLPDGVDLVFNTNKSPTGNKLDAMKELNTKRDGSVDMKNPFGTFPKPGGQILGPDGKPTSALNILREEGDWDKWSKNLSSQVLSKQSPDLARRQLDLTYERRKEEFDEIRNLTNPEIRRTLLKTFAEETDSAAVHLKAANMPGQATKVLLPSNHVKPTEIFAPDFRDGDRVALVRFPHAGTFEIPELTVNNRGLKAQETFKQMGKTGKDVPDAVLIHPKVAERLSGADFDGDTVVVIPNNNRDIKSTHALDGLKGFDPKQYKVPTPKEDPVNGRYTITPEQKQKEMGRVTNLISDMQIKGASEHEVVQAVRHSMVVIDSEKHNLDYKASERQNNIRALKKKYQPVVDQQGRIRGGGAATLLTRATSEQRVNRRKAAPATEFIKEGIDIRTGKKVYVDTGEHSVKYPDPKSRRVTKTKSGKDKVVYDNYVTKTFRSKEEAEAFVRDKAPSGKISQRQFKSTKLAERDDAFELVSDHGGHEIERVYASHSNRLKAMADEARKEMINTKPIPYNSTARETYKHEVASLDAKLNVALKNSPRERQAQAIAQGIVQQRKRENPGMQADEIRKIRGQALTEARIRTNANKTRIGIGDSKITDREWEAIQAGAITKTQLRKILANSDLDVIKERATPRQNRIMTDAATIRAKQMRANGATYAEIAQQLGIPTSTLKSALGEG